MKKQYMDFVPAGRVAKTRTAPKKAARAVAEPAASRKSAVSKKPVVSRKPAAKEVAAVGFAGERKLGVVEDMSAKFVKTDVPKRPLSAKPHFRATGVAAAKAEKVGLFAAAKATGREKTGGKVSPAAKTGVELVEKSVEKSAARAGKTGAAARNTFQVPKTPFINQNKVEKRPLSKNVYAKKVVAAVEEPKGPITIISKPESGAHVGLIVTVILTIILGAAAGTVAFLLLPK